MECPYLMRTLGNPPDRGLQPALALITGRL
jgi:hypothetical protein